MKLKYGDVNKRQTNRASSPPNAAFTPKAARLHTKSTYRRSAAFTPKAAKRRAPGTCLYVDFVWRRAPLRRVHTRSGARLERVYALTLYGGAPLRRVHTKSGGSGAPPYKNQRIDARTNIERIKRTIRYSDGNRKELVPGEEPFFPCTSVYCDSAMRNSAVCCEWAGRYFMNGGSHVTAAPPEQIFLTDCQQAHAKRAAP